MEGGVGKCVGVWVSVRRGEGEVQGMWGSVEKCVGV